MNIGPVRKDPRGKISQGGEREHVFLIRTGDFIRVVRRRNRAEAEEARETLLDAIRQAGQELQSAS